MSSIVNLQGSIQNYQWGGYDFLAELLGTHNTQKQPQAEYWLGVHPSCQTQVDQQQNLSDYLSTQSLSLNFLMKVLDVRDMLSVQVHPNRHQAERGYERETQADIPLDAKHRNYKDRNHKPELMVALSEFWLLHGFREKAAIIDLLEAQAFLVPIAQLVRGTNLQAAFARVLDEHDPLIEQAHKDLQFHFSNIEALSDKTQVDYWVQQWLRNNPDTLKGILAIYFLNLCHLREGEAIYQPAGLLHAYLEGQNIELMANSDNVLRAGLTPKHIDTQELMNIGHFAPSNSIKYQCEKTSGEDNWLEYLTPFEEFGLSQANASWHRSYQWRSQQCEIILCTAGSAVLQSSAGQSIELERGSALLIAPELKLELSFSEAAGQVFRAFNKDPL